MAVGLLPLMTCTTLELDAVTYNALLAQQRWNMSLGLLQRCEEAGLQVRLTGFDHISMV